MFLPMSFYGGKSAQKMKTHILNAYGKTCSLSHPDISKTNCNIQVVFKLSSSVQRIEYLLTIIPMHNSKVLRWEHLYKKLLTRKYF